MHLNIILLVLAGQFLASSAFCKDNSCQISVETKIESNKMLLVQGLCYSCQDKSQMRYQLVTKKTGEGGTSISRQSGEFLTLVTETVELCRVRLNTHQGDRFHFTLKIYEQDQEVAAVVKVFEIL